MENTVKSRYARHHLAWLAALAFVVACDDYTVTLTILDCAPDACVRPPSGRRAQFRMSAQAPSEDGVVVTVNGQYAARIDQSGDSWLITAGQSWSQLGRSISVRMKGYSNCKIRCDRWMTDFDLSYAEKAWDLRALPQTLAPDAFALPTTGGNTVLVQREAMGEDGLTPWVIRGEYPFQVYPGAPWPMFVDAFGRPGALDPDAFGRTQPTSMWRVALPEGQVLGRLDRAIYVVQGDVLLRVTEDAVDPVGAAPVTDHVLAAQDSLWLVLRSGEPDSSAYLQHIENGAEIPLPGDSWPVMEILRGPAHAMVYERVTRTEDAPKPYTWQRYRLDGEAFELESEVQGYMATIQPQGLGVIEASLAQQPGDTEFGFALGADWIWVSHAVASLVRSQYWGESHAASWDNKVRDW